MIAVERSIDAPCVRLAQKEGIPVLIGLGDDRSTLELAGARHCSMVAAVTSDDLVNVAVGLTASDVRPGIPLALRLGDGGIASETDLYYTSGRSSMHITFRHDTRTGNLRQDLAAACGPPERGS